MDADNMAKGILNNQPEGNRLRGRPRISGWNYVYADLKKCKLFDWKKRTDRDCWKKFIEEKAIIGL